jgi:ribosomal protein L11 methyltransferase
MFSLLLHCSPADEDVLSAELMEAGSTGITEEPEGLRAFFEDSQDAPTLARRFVRNTPQLRREVNIDWAQVSRNAWPPLLVGDRFFLVPPWCTDPVPAGRIRLEINPGMACGTGWHPCTQLCLAALEQNVRPGDRVLDVGCGSGILCLAATLLGAQVVIGCDVDLDAVAIAREQVPCPIFAGSVDAIRTASVDVVVANISSTVLEDLAEEFERARKPGSTLILSGFQECEEIEGFQIKSRTQAQEWLCAVC